MKKLTILLLTIIMFLPIKTIYAEELKPNTQPEIIAPSAVVIDAKTGIVLYDKDMNEQNYPASITKIMTALLVIEKIEKENIPLTDKVPFSREAVYSLPFGTSHIAMDSDDFLEVGDALYALMLASANEVANALAEYVSGSNEAFGKLMTKRAKELGAVNTNFTNPHGLHDEEHYTTAKDMALIMREAVKHPLFKKLISTVSYEIPPTLKQPLKRPLHNSNKMIIPSHTYYNEAIVGSKTGFTNEAMHTLVSLAERDGIELIIAVLHDQKDKIYTDTTTLIDYGVTQYDDISLSKLITKNILPKVNASSGEEVSVELSLAQESFKLPKAAVDFINTDYKLNKIINPPILKGSKLGSLNLFCNDYKLTSLDIVASLPVFPSVHEKSENSSFSFDITTIVQILISVTILTLLAILLIMIINYRVNYSRRRRRTRVSTRVSTVPAHVRRNYKYKNNW